jgi:hypothetical protein
MLMVKGDKKAKRFREEVQTLNEFAKTNEVPEVGGAAGGRMTAGWAVTPKDVCCKTRQCINATSEACTGPVIAYTECQPQGY